MLQIVVIDNIMGQCLPAKSRHILVITGGSDGSARQGAGHRGPRQGHKVGGQGTSANTAGRQGQRTATRGQQESRQPTKEAGGDGILPGGAGGPDGTFLCK